MATKKTLNYQKSRDELDSVIGQLENGDLDIDQALKLYQRGNALIGELQTYLKQAENSVKKVQANKP